MVKVTRDDKIPWNPDSENITITTDSEEGSWEMLRVVFYDDNDELAGDVMIYFSKTLRYNIANCYSSSITNFSSLLLYLSGSFCWICCSFNALHLALWGL